MKKNILSLLLFSLVTPLFAQKQQFDIISYSPVAGYELIRLLLIIPGSL